MSAAEAAEAAEPAEEPETKLDKSVPAEAGSAGGEAGAGWRTGDCEASQYFSPSLVGRRAWSSAASNINMQPRLDTKFEVHRSEAADHHPPASVSWDRPARPHHRTDLSPARGSSCDNKQGEN